MSKTTTGLLDRFKNFFRARIPMDRRSLPMLRMPPQPLVPSMLDQDQVAHILTESDSGNPLLLMSLYDIIVFSDSHLQGELCKRILAVLGDPITVGPKDPKNADDVRAASFLRDQVSSTPSWLGGMSHLLFSTLFPVSIVERIYKLSTKKGVTYDLAELIPVRMELLYFDPTGPLRIWDVDPTSNMITATNKCVDPMRYVTHRGHLLGDRDHRGGPMRSLVFWWLFSGFNRDWWARFLDKYGSPFLVGKYDQDDDDSRLVLQRAFSLATRLGGIVISKETEVAIEQAMSQSAGEAFNTFHTICKQEMSKLIVGQTTSASGKDAGGLGSSGVADAQREVRGDIRQYDRVALGETVRHQIFRPLQQINNIPGEVTVTWGGEAVEDTGKTATALASLANAGVELTDDGIIAFGERMGLGLRRKVILAPDPGSAPANPLTALNTLHALTATPPRHGSEAFVHAVDAANARLARAGSADLARAFEHDLAPIRRILAESTDAADFQARLRDAFPHFSPRQTLPLLEAGLTALAANGL